MSKTHILPAEIYVKNRLNFGFQKLTSIFDRDIITYRNGKGKVNIWQENFGSSFLNPPFLYFLSHIGQAPADFRPEPAPLFAEIPNKLDVSGNWKYK